MAETFRRREIKYRVDEARLPGLLEEIGRHAVPDAYNADGRTYSITNLYMDTPDDWFIRRSLRGPRYKEKLRLRGYGTAFDEHTPVYLEIKKKVNKVVNKRRIRLPLGEAMRYLDHPDPAALQAADRQVGAEIAWLLHSHPAVPKLFLAYERLAFSGTEDAGLRITFDSRIRTRRERVDLTAGNDGEALLPADERLMEIKVPGAIPFWLARLLSAYQITPTHFSKYGAEYRRRIQQEEDIVCCSPCKPYLQPQNRPCRFGA